tara:strand:- start:261 stop:626 length:366 start_codon:yes stop_codon:yes gene_type:complete
MYQEVACGIMFNKEGKLLLGERSDNKYWEFPGGKCEINETIEECLQREWIEELNLEIMIDKEICNYVSGRYLCRFFIGQIVDESKIKKNVHTNIKFVKINELMKENLFEDDKQLIYYLMNL